MWIMTTLAMPLPSEFQPVAVIAPIRQFNNVTASPYVDADAGMLQRLQC